MDGYPAVSPHRLGRIAATQEWHDVTMVHWRVDARVLGGLLPDGLEPDVFDGSAWTSLVPFRMVGLTLPPVPALPLVGTFPETNVRSYVRGTAGPAVWFHSLDVPRVFMPPTARFLFGVPYTWSRMRVSRRGDRMRYWAQRRWPEPVGARSRVGVRIGPSVEPDDLDRFLVNRWGAYSLIRGRLHHTPVVHDPWPLQQADPTLLYDRFSHAAGLTISTVERVRYAQAARAVRFGWPEPV